MNEPEDGPADTPTDAPSRPLAPLVVHLLHRFDFGGLETLVAECINRMAPGSYRHAIVCLTDYTSFAEKITRPDVALHALHKPPGLGLGTHRDFYRLMRRLRPAIVHTYNLSALEYNATAALAGVPVRIHAEHGRDAGDPSGVNRKHNMLRRAIDRFVDAYVPVSVDLQRWLGDVVGIAPAKTKVIANGVDTAHFSPPARAAGTSPAAAPADVADMPFSTAAGHFVVGTVGRIQDVKDHRGLVEAFRALRLLFPDRADLRLAIVGDGPLMPQLRRQVQDAGLAELVWLPGSRTDIAAIMRGWSVFAMSSIAEGTPVTILEAMSAGLPIAATRVGGIPEVVRHEGNGLLVPPGQPATLAAALARYAHEPGLAAVHGDAGRALVVAHNSVAAMVLGYATLYDGLCRRKINIRKAIQSCAE